MELEEIKNAWLSVDERLKKQEMMNERMIKETLQSKSKKALSKLNGYELFGVIVCFAMLPLVIFMIGKGNFYRPNQLANFLLYFCAAMLAVGCITQSIKLLILAKINFTKALSSNVRIVQRYKLFIRKEKMVTWIITPIITVLLILIFVSLNSKFITCRYIYKPELHTRFFLKI